MRRRHLRVGWHLVGGISGPFRGRDESAGTSGSGFDESAGTSVSGT